MDEVKASLVKIRDVAYEAEYLINLHLGGNVPLWDLSLRLPAVIHKLKVIRIRLQETKKIYDTKVLGVSKYYSREVSSPRAPPTAGVNNLVIGFEDNKMKILDDLIGGSEELNIISIVGMPGLGKTTTANKLYNDESIYDHFDLRARGVRARGVASQAYQKRNVLIEILTSMGTKLEEHKILKMEVKDLGLEIYQSLKGQRYLIIIDDVWHSDMWNDLRRYFPNDANGSIIMLTSLIKDTAPESTIYHTIPLLSDIQCWDLLAKKVFYKEPCPPQLIDIGKCISAKCNGLPLAVIVIAGILGNLEKKESVWKKVERNLDSYIMEDGSKCMKILELSYEHLPDHLKLCFLYLGVFPEDTMIPTRKLMRLWIVEGFIKKEEEQSQEDIAEQYLLDLINRSLLHVAGTRSDGGIKACGMHDLLRDMCLKRAREENFLISIKDQSSIYEKHYHLSDYSTSPTSWRNFSLHCRSILGHFIHPSYRFPQMRLLRVIDELQIKNFPHSLNRLDLLVHLRYLVVTRMPGPQVANRINLEVIRVENKFVRFYKPNIPSVYSNMKKLSHLHMKDDRGDGLIFGKDWDTCQTTTLKSVSCISFTTKRDEDISRFSPNLRTLKCKCNKQRVFPDLRSFTELESEKVMFEIRHCYGGNVPTKFYFPSTIKKLTLCRIRLNWGKLSILGKLPNLQVLKLLKDAFAGEEWKTRDGEFPELTFLKLDLFTLKRWLTESEHFPKLQRLVLNRCREKLEIPSELGNVPTLQRIEVISCENETNESAARIEEEQLEYGNEELKVFIQKKSR